jgi:hypothetical protein
MDADRRNTFRASHAETREGILVARGSSLRVRIIEESSGGLSVASTRNCPFPTGSELRFSTDDGDELGVKLVYFQKEGRSNKMGLQRLAKCPSFYDERRGTRPLILLLGITIGLYVGLAVRSETLRSTIAHFTPFKHTSHIH